MAGKVRSGLGALIIGLGNPSVTYTLQVYDAPELKLTIYQPRQEGETEQKMKRLLNW